MKYRCFHNGDISEARKKCLDRQADIFGKDWEFFSDWPEGFAVPGYTDIREAKDLLYVQWMFEGFFVLDSDLYPNYRYEPKEEGIYLPHSFGRLDYYCGAAIGEKAKKLMEDMIQYHNEKHPGFLWPLDCFGRFPKLIKHIPGDTFIHQAIITSKRNYLKQGIALDSF